MKITFKEWLEKEELDEGWKDIALAGALAAGAVAGVPDAKAANTPASVSDPQDSVGMIPQVRDWDNINKKGHMEDFDKDFIYIRFTDSPGILSKVPRQSLSERDEEYVSQYERMANQRAAASWINRGNNNSRHIHQDQDQDVRQQSGTKKFNPKFGPKPAPRKTKSGDILDPTPTEIWKYQAKIVVDEEAKMRRGAKPSVNYLMLFKYYGGQMPDPPEE